MQFSRVVSWWWWCWWWLCFALWFTRNANAHQWWLRHIQIRHILSLISPSYTHTQYRPALGENEKVFYLSMHQCVCECISSYRSLLFINTLWLQFVFLAHRTLIRALSFFLWAFMCWIGTSWLSVPPRRNILSALYFNRQLNTSATSFSLFWFFFLFLSPLYPNNFVQTGSVTWHIHLCGLFHCRCIHTQIHMLFCCFTWNLKWGFVNRWKFLISLAIHLCLLCHVRDISHSLIQLYNMHTLIDVGTFDCTSYSIYLFINCY